MVCYTGWMHVVSALKQRRAEIAGEIRSLSEALAHLDATIRLFEAGKPPKPKQRQLLRGVLGLLHEEGPMTSKQLAERLDAPLKRVMGTLCYQRDRGRVRAEKHAGELVWEIAK